MGCRLGCRSRAGRSARTRCWTPPTRWSRRLDLTGVGRVSEVRVARVGRYVGSLFVVGVHMYRGKYYGKQISRIKAICLPMYIPITMVHELYFFYSYTSPHTPRRTSITPWS